MTPVSRLSLTLCVTSSIMCCHTLFFSHSSRGPSLVGLGRVEWSLKLAHAACPAGAPICTSCKPLARASRIII
jgi:hypothetical protein